MKKYIKPTTEELGVKPEQIMAISIFNCDAQDLDGDGYYDESRMLDELPFESFSSIIK